MGETPPTASSPDRTLAYARAVVAGEIVAGPHVRNACKRHIADLKRKDGIWFDHDAANHAFAFFEEVLKLSEGQFEGQPFEARLLRQAEQAGHIRPGQPRRPVDATGG